MEVRRILVDQPYFSICIPQYNRTSFLIETCKSLANQTFKNFEVCISDDCSTDGRGDELIEFLKGSALSFTYSKQERNRRYDGNLRASIGLARGQLCFLLGNDDSLILPTTLEDLYYEIKRFEPIGVVITNYEDFATGRRFARIKKTGLVGSGPLVAVTSFRNFSFVSGILLDTAKAKSHATEKWDGSEMYQMFIGCRIIAEGSLLLTINRITVRKDIEIPGEYVDSCALRPRLNPCPVLERRLPLGMIGRLVADAIEPYVKPAERAKLFERIFLQILVLTYPYWIIEYRRIQSRRYALGVCLGMRPRNILDGINLSWIRSARLMAIYGLTSLCGLIAPVRLFKVLYPCLYSIAKAIR